MEHLPHQQARTPTTPAGTSKADWWPIRVDKEAFPHQTEGLEAWWKGGGRGVVVLPTGTGKTHLANLAIEKAGRPTLSSRRRST